MAREVEKKTSSPKKTPSPKRAEHKRAEPKRVKPERKGVGDNRESKRSR